MFIKFLILIRKKSFNKNRPCVTTYTYLRERSVRIFTPKRITEQRKPVIYLKAAKTNRNKDITINENWICPYLLHSALSLQITRPGSHRRRSSRL